MRLPCRNLTSHCQQLQIIARAVRINHRERLMTTHAETFRFLNPGPLIDGELELVAPDVRWIDDHLQSCHHPLTKAHMPQHANATKETFMEFLRSHPGGRQAPQPAQDLVPAYHFWMHVAPHFGRVLPIAGAVGLRIGNTLNIELYFGHIGYHVYPAARGHRYAQRACRLLFPLARAHGFSSLWITCNPDNIPSRRTCERLGGTLVNIVPLPLDNVLYTQGDRDKCRYRIDI